MPEDTASIGAALNAARQSRGLSVEDVAAATRIRATLVRAIEADDFSRCGGAAYARGHIRQIARVVGADPQELVDAYDRDHEDAVPRLSAAPMPPFDPPGRVRGLSRPTARWASAAAAVLGVLAVFLIVSWLAGRGGGRTPAQAGGPSSPVAPSPASVSGTPPAVTSAPTRSPARPLPPTGVSVLVRAAAGESWLLVTGSGGQQVYQGVLSAGAERAFRDPRLLTVKFGNSRAVSLTVNGQDVGPPRCDTPVCSQQFAPAGATAG